MIDLELTREQLDELHKEASENPSACGRKNVGWSLHGKWYVHQEVADVKRVDGDTVTAYLRT